VFGGPFLVRLSGLLGRAGSEMAQNGFERRERLVRISLAAVLLGLLSGACRQEGAAVAQTPSVSLEASEKPEATWRYHPLEKAPQGAVLSLEAGGTLEVDEAGTRWLLLPGQEPRSGATFAPEPLVGLRKHRGKFISLGKSGAVYVFEEPLGAFSDVRPPPSSLLRARFVDEKILGVRDDGTLHRSSDWGRSWHALEHEAFFTHVTSPSPGEVLALSVPETWHRSTDGGTTFTRLDQKPIAPRSLHRSEEGELIVEGLYSQYIYEKGVFSEKSATGETRKAYPMAPFPRAAAILEGKGSLHGDHYLEISSREKGWTRQDAKIGRPLSSGPVQGLPTCSRFRVKHAGATVAVLCSDPEKQDGIAKLRLFRSEDLGRTFRAISGKFRGDFKKVRFAVSSGKEIAMSHLCPPHLSEAGCAPSGLTVVGKKGETEFRDIPGFTEVDAVRYGEKGSLFAMGRRGKDGHTLLARIPSGDGAEKSVELWDLSLRAEYPSHRALRVSLHPASDGSLSAVGLDGGEAYIAVYRPGENALELGRSPTAIESISGAGERLMALNTSDDFVWESLTGGLSWTRRALPRQLCNREVACVVPLECSGAGCLVGRELSRLGWGKDQAIAPVELPLSTTDQPKEQESVGVNCRAQGDFEELPELVQMPTASDSGFRKTLWAQVQLDTKQASATAVHGSYGAAALKTHDLLPPVSDGEAYAYGHSPQVEGAAVFRFRIPPSVATLQPTRIEVAWDNRMSDMIGRGELSRAFASSPMSVSSKRRAAPALISVAGRGLFLELFDGSRARKVAYFFDDEGKSSPVEEVEFPRSVPGDGGWMGDSEIMHTARAERLVVHGKQEALLLLAGSRVMVRAWKDLPGETEPSFSPYLMGFLTDTHARQFQGVSIAYRGQDVGFLSKQVNGDGKGHRAHYVALGEERAFEAPVAVPLLPDLPRIPNRCSAAQRQESPRTVAPDFPGPRRSVTVLGRAGEKLNMVLAAAVLYGTPEAPCVASWEANSSRITDKKRSLRYRTVLDPGGVSWLFRETLAPNSRRKIEVQRMSCVYDGESRP